jgi:hypothetical protein
MTTTISVRDYLVQDAELGPERFLDRLHEATLFVRERLTEVSQLSDQNVDINRRITRRFSALVQQAGEQPQVVDLVGRIWNWVWGVPNPEEAIAQARATMEQWLMVVDRPPYDLNLIFSDTKSFAEIVCTVERLMLGQDWKQSETVWKLEYQHGFQQRFSAAISHERGKLEAEWEKTFFVWKLWIVLWASSAYDLLDKADKLLGQVQTDFTPSLHASAHSQKGDACGGGWTWV